MKFKTTLWVSAFALSQLISQAHAINHDMESQTAGKQVKPLGGNSPHTLSPEQLASSAGVHLTEWEGNRKDLSLLKLACEEYDEAIPKLGDKITANILSNAAYAQLMLWEQTKQGSLEGAIILFEKAMARFTKEGKAVPAVVLKNAAHAYLIKWMENKATNDLSVAGRLFDQAISTWNGPVPPAVLNNAGYVFFKLWQASKSVPDLIKASGYIDRALAGYEKQAGVPITLAVTAAQAHFDLWKQDNKNVVSLKKAKALIDGVLKSKPTLPEGLALQKEIDAAIAGLPK